MTLGFNRPDQFRWTALISLISVFTAGPSHFSCPRPSLSREPNLSVALLLRRDRLHNLPVPHARPSASLDVPRWQTARARPVGGCFVERSETVGENGDGQSGETESYTSGRARSVIMTIKIYETLRKERGARPK